MREGAACRFEHGSFGQFRQKYGLISPNLKMLLYLWYAFKDMQQKIVWRERRLFCMPNTDGVSVGGIGMKKTVYLTMAAVVCAAALTGCQKTPDAAESNGILHAQGDMERQVQDIAAADDSGQTETETGMHPQGAGRYQGTVGTGGNIININAEIPGVPDNLSVITLKPDDGLDMDALRAFLDSESGAVEDTSQEFMRQIEDNDKENTTPQESGERFLYSIFGDHTALRLSDGKKEALFKFHTGAYYVDHDLLEKCHGIYSGNYSETYITQDQMGEGSFSAERAKEILLDKLEAVGVGDIAMKKIYYIKGDGYSYYEMQFVPVYDGIAVDIGSDSYTLGQVFPSGFGFVTEEGVADVNLMDFCGKVAEKEPVTVISFEQVLKILEQYLDNGMIVSDGTIIYDRVELNYYPVPNPAPDPDAIEYKSELTLTPIWHIYMPIDEYVDGGYDYASGPSHICVNAVTGELAATD